MPAPSIHDNRIVRCAVDGERRRIVLHTRFEEREPMEHTDIVFEGVLAYHFEGDNFGNIIFGIEEVAIEQLVEENRALFEQGMKYAWPGPWNESPETSLRHFQAVDAKAFQLSSSYGLAGWVVAAECRLEVLPTDGSNKPVQPTPLRGAADRRR